MIIASVFAGGGMRVTADDETTRANPAAADAKDGGNDGHRAQRGGRPYDRPYPSPKQAWNVATIILGSPTDKQICMDIHVAGSLEDYIEYVRSRRPEDATPAHPDGEIAFAYGISATRPRSDAR